MKALLRRKAFYVVIALVAIALGCNRMFDFAGKTGPADTITLIQDSQQIRDLIARQEADQPSEQRTLQNLIQERKEQVRIWEPAKVIAQHLDTHAQQYIPRRLAFIAEMTREPAVSVPARDIQLVEHTRAGCSEKASKDWSYVRVRISEGTDTGAEGWVCRGETADAVHLTRDSPRVRKLIASAATGLEAEWQTVLRAIRLAAGFDQNGGSLSEELYFHPERFIPKRLAFLESMRLQPAASAVARNSYVRFLERTSASCASDPLLAQNHYYVRIRMTTGPSKGQEG